MKRALAVGATVALIGALSGPDLLMALHRGKQKRTMGDMRTLATAVESWSIDHHEYPIASSVDELMRQLGPDRSSRLPTRDAWGRPFAYWSDGTEYLLACRGADARWDASSLRRDPSGATREPDMRNLLLGQWRLIWEWAGRDQG